jgi:hypothetical protein
VSRLARKGPVVLLAVLAAGGLLVAGFRPWVSGVVDDPVLGATRIEATGAQVAPGLSALALALAAAAVAVVATGRVARVVALVAWAGALVTAAVLTGRVLADPSVALGGPGRRRRLGDRPRRGGDRVTPVGRSVESLRVAVRRGRRRGAAWRAGLERLGRAERGP